jgi:predicted Zn-dependent protease
MVKLRLVILFVSVFLSSHVGAASGKKMHEEVMKNYKVYEDKELQQYVENIGRKILKASDIQGEYTFTLLDDPMLNAFAHIGGYIYVSRGLLAYVNSEAQLASVIGHEIAHVTQGHVKGHQSQTILGDIAALVVAAASGSPEVLEAGTLLNASLQRSHGRNNELEADSVGAQYMATAGYDPNEVVEMLSALKNNELHSKERAGDRGAARQTYHGLFASHPRNDARLRGVIDKARRLSTSESPYQGVTAFRDATKALVWGENFQKKNLAENDYLNESRRIRIKFPEQWSVQDTSMQDGNTLAEAQSKEKKSNMTLREQRRTIQPPEDFIFNTLKLKNVEDGKAITPSGLKGYTGIIVDEKGKKSRVAVIYYKLNAYIFFAESKSNKQFEKDDEQFMAAINSFRTVTQREIEGQKPRKLKWVKATSSSNYEAIAKSLDLGRYGVQELRLINNDYPNQEPIPGEWIKIIVK